MKKNLFQLSLLFFLCTSVLCGCSDNDEPILSTDGTTLTVHATADGFTSADGVDTRASENLYTTTFINGDQIGVFAVKGGQVITDCKNVPLTYKDGSWEGTVYYYADAQYFAYYPYDASMNGKTSVDDIVKAFKPQDNQSSYANYTKSDLMTADVVSPSDKTLRFSFAHKMSLIEISLPVQKYITLDGYEYSPPVIGATFSIASGGNGQQQPMTPCPMGCGVYRYIVPAEVSHTVGGEFLKSDGKIIEYRKEKFSLSAGNYKRLNVSYDGAPSGEPQGRALEVGDFYYSDGGIWPKEATSNPPSDGCIGVVYCVDGSFITNSSSKKDEDKYTHALVVALKDAGISNWDGASSLASSYKDKALAPESSSGWYLPNLDELKYICYGEASNGTNGKENLNNSFRKLGMGGFANKSYWSSSEINAYYAYHVNFSNGDVHNDYKPLNDFLVRAVLAF